MSGRVRARLGNGVDEPVCPYHTDSTHASHLTDYPLCEGWDPCPGCHSDPCHPDCLEAAHEREEHKTFAPVCAACAAAEVADEQAFGYYR